MDVFQIKTLRILFALLWVTVPSLYAQIGGVDTLFPPLLDGAVNATAVQSDGKVVIAGEFTSVNGSSRNRVARLNPDGSLDGGFAANLAGANATVWSIALDWDGKLLIGGEFTTVNGTGCNRIARLNTDGTLDSSFDSGTGANDTVYAIAIDRRDIYIGGAFTSINGTTRNRIAGLRSNGNLDSSVFGSSGANDTIYAMVSNGRDIYIGGAFTSLYGSVRKHLARFRDLSLDPFFNAGANAGPNGPVYTIALTRNSPVTNIGGLLVGGDFTTIGSASHLRLALLNTGSGSPDTSFNISADATVRCISVDGEPVGTSSATKIVIGGDFSSINGAPRGRVARITYTSSSLPPIDPIWSLDSVYDTGAGANASVRCMATQSDSKTFIGGQFTSVNGNSRSGFARLYGDGGSTPPITPPQPAAGAGTETQLVLVWSSVSHASGYRIERSPNGVNDWLQINPETLGRPPQPYIDAGLSPGTTYFYRITAFSTNGDSLPSPVASAATLAAPWKLAGAPDLNFLANIGSGTVGSVYSVVPQPNGKIFVGGTFSSFNGTACKNLARLNSDGSLDSTFSTVAGPSSTVRSIAVQSDGKVVIGGDFTSVGGYSYNRIARLNSDGTLDTTFTISSGANFTVRSIAIQPNSQILVAGYFSTFNGQPHDGIVRLNADGSLDSSFNANLFFSNAYNVTLQPDGKILVSGFFQKVNGTDRGNISRLNSDGTLDTTFARGQGANSWIDAMQLQRDGRIVIAGPFDRYDGVSRRGVARLLSDGSLDTSFDPGIGVENGWTNSVGVQGDGKVILGGWFTRVGGTVRVRLARLNADGMLDSSFVPGIGVNNDVRALAVQPDGKCIAAGLFTTTNGVTSNSITRLFADNGNNVPTPAQNLSTSVLSSSSIRLSWTDVTFSSGYKVFHSADGSSGWKQIATLPADTTSFTLADLTRSTPAYFRVRAYNTNGDSIDSGIVTATTYSAYEQWKLDNGISVTTPDMGDFDGDGILNIMEYALDSNPRIPGMNKLPAVAVSGSTLTLTYSRIHNDIEYAVEVSNDLVSWTTNGVDQGGSGQLVSASVPIGSDERKFLRLRISVREEER